MTTRSSAPTGAPCWADLWTSDVEGSRRFYGELFGWEAQEPSADFGGYFMFTRQGVPVAGGMGDMGDMKATDTWKVYLATDDANKALTVAGAEGAEVTGEAMAVGDLGVQALLDDPTGAALGIWQAGSFPGFTVLAEDGAPSWFELHTRDHARALGFYRSVFGWEVDSVSDTDEFRYSTLRGGDGEWLAGVMDAAAFLPADEPSSWSIYWEVDDMHAALERVTRLGGAVRNEAEDTPYGRLAVACDPAGAQFKLRTSPR